MVCSCVTSHGDADTPKHFLDVLVGSAHLDSEVEHIPNEDNVEWPISCDELSDLFLVNDLWRQPLSEERDEVLLDLALLSEGSFQSIFHGKRLVLFHEVAEIVHRRLLGGLDLGLD